MQTRITKLRKLDKFHYYFIGLIGLLVGVKTCDAIFYDEKKLLRVREEI
jgi:hypothetical protein